MIETDPMVSYGQWENVGNKTLSLTCSFFAKLLLLAPQQVGALALAGLGVEAVHAEVGAPVLAAAAALLVLLNLHLLPPLLLVPPLQVRLDHHVHPLLNNLQRKSLSKWPLEI